jgi:hypothetical protein
MTAWNTCWQLGGELAQREGDVLLQESEMWRNWKGKCRLVQLLHNGGVEKTGEAIRQLLGWQVAEEVREEWRRSTATRPGIGR